MGLSFPKRAHLWHGKDGRKRWDRRQPDFEGEVRVYVPLSELSAAEAQIRALSRELARQEERLNEHAYGILPGGPG